MIGMKIGVSSYSFSDYIRHTGCDYRKICDMAKQIGFDGIEFIALDDPYLGVTTDAKKTAVELREYCAGIGLEIVAYTISADFLAEDREAEMAALRANIDVAAELGAGILRHDVATGPRDIYGYTYRDAIKEMAPQIRKITEYAAAKGIRTCTENHGRFFQDAHRVSELIQAVNHPNYGWLVDIGNFMGVDGDIPKSVLTAAPYAFHMHAKDNLYKSGTEIVPDGWRCTRGGNYTRPTVLGHGVVPVRQCLGIMKQSGYDGYVSLEYEGWEENIRAVESGYAFLKKLI